LSSIATPELWRVPWIFYLPGYEEMIALVKGMVAAGV
jgi:hypothetical protein